MVFNWRGFLSSEGTILLYYKKRYNREKQLRVRHSCSITVDLDGVRNILKIGLNLGLFGLYRVR